MLLLVTRCPSVRLVRTRIVGFVVALDESVFAFQAFYFDRQRRPRSRVFQEVLLRHTGRHQESVCLGIGAREMIRLTSGKAEWNFWTGSILSFGRQIRYARIYRESRVLYHNIGCDNKKASRKIVVMHNYAVSQLAPCGTTWIATFAL